MYTPTTTSARAWSVFWDRSDTLYLVSFGSLSWPFTGLFWYPSSPCLSRTHLFHRPEGMTHIPRYLCRIIKSSNISVHAIMPAHAYLRARSLRETLHFCRYPVVPRIGYDGLSGLCTLDVIHWMIRDADEAGKVQPHLPCPQMLTAFGFGDRATEN